MTFIHRVVYPLFLFQLNLMRQMHRSIIDDTFPVFVKDFFLRQFPNKDYPQWAVDALRSVNVNLDNT